MIIATDDDRWTRLYYAIRDQIMEDDSWDRIPGMTTPAKLEAAFMSMGMRLHKVDGDTRGETGRWTHVELLDGINLEYLALRWL